jgi:hypothetical protein
MQSAIRLKTRVLPGNRIEVSDPALRENEEVELIVLKTNGQAPDGQFASAWDYLKSLEPIHRTSEEWEAIERVWR